MRSPNKKKTTRVVRFLYLLDANSYWSVTLIFAGAQIKLSYGGEQLSDLDNVIVHNVKLRFFTSFGIPR